MSPRLHSFADLAMLFGPDAKAPVTKNGGTAEAGRREDFAMEVIAQQRPRTNALPNFPGPNSRTLSGTDAEIETILGYMFRAADRRAPVEMYSEVVLMSPEAARYILTTRNAGNRPVRQVRVDEFEKIIREGRWKLTSQGISFSREGQLNNGQHRLNGIVQSGQTVGLYVTMGEDRDVFDVLDTGAVRGGADALHISGYKNTATLAAAARLLITVEGNHVFKAPKIRNDEILQVLARCPKLEDATVAGHTLGAKFRCSSAATTVAIYRILMLTRRPELIDGFVEKLSSGSGLDARDPILVLRDGLQTKKVDSHVRLGNQKTLAQYAAIVKAWNLHIRKRKGSLRWEHPEPLPRPE